MVAARALVLLLAACASPALAAQPVPVPPALEAAFGATLVSTYPDGRQAKLWLARDGGYTGQGRRGGMSSGRWSVDGQRLCMKQSRPLPVPFRFCTPIVSGGVGTRWTAKAVGGEAVTVQLVAGAAPAPTPPPS